MRRFVALIVFFLASAALVAAPPASAGTFEVSACDAAPGFVNNSWRAEVTNPAMVIYNQCPSSDNPRFGLGARHRYASRGSAPTGAATRWRFEAPPGAAVVGVRANALFVQFSPRWQVGLFTRSRLVSGCRGGRRTGGVCVGAMSAGDYVPLPPSDLLYAEVYCARGPCPLGTSRRPTAHGSMTFVRVTVADGIAPAVGNVGGDLWSARWLSGTRQVSFDATDATGIKEVRVSVDGTVKAAARRDCDPTLKTCPDWPGAMLTVATNSDLPDGKHTLSLEAVDRADNVGGPTRDVFIDNTPPAAPQALAVIGGDAWRAAPTFEVGWKNPHQEFAPIAGVEYTLCPSPPLEAPCVRGTSDAAGIESLRGLQVPQPGDWLLTAWLRDAAGNARPETAAPPVHLRFDPAPPVATIRATDPEDPSRVSVDASDAVSGVVRGEIEMRRVGTKTWRPLEAAAVPGGFSAQLRDERMRDGVYDLRAHVWDAAGNERSTTQFASGQPAQIVLPLRVKTLLRVGKAVKLRARRQPSRPASHPHGLRPSAVAAAGPPYPPSRPPDSPRRQSARGSAHRGCGPSRSSGLGIHPGGNAHDLAHGPVQLPRAGRPEPGAAVSLRGRAEDPAADTGGRDSRARGERDPPEPPLGRQRRDGPVRGQVARWRHPAGRQARRAAVLRPRQVAHVPDVASGRQWPVADRVPVRRNARRQALPLPRPDPGGVRLSVFNRLVALGARDGARAIGREETSMGNLRRHLSYANVMATLAVFIALGGSAYAVTQLPRNSVGAAQIKRDAVGSSELRNRSVRLSDISVRARRSLRGTKGAQGPPGPSGVTFHAAVNSGGSAVRGNATGFAHQGGSGLYVIAFGRDVSSCDATATLAAVQNGPVLEQPTPGRITVAAAEANLAVRTFDVDGSIKDQPFNVIVVC